MANRLAKEDSPYLQQHKNNPVNWYPWCEEAFKEMDREKFFNNSLELRKYLQHGSASRVTEILL